MIVDYSVKKHNSVYLMPPMSSLTLTLSMFSGRLGSKKIRIQSPISKSVRNRTDKDSKQLHIFVTNKLAFFMFRILRIQFVWY
jgi:hypothetical protein